jgi:lipopolysaccharide biosynthesis regulator YciM
MLFTRTAIGVVLALGAISVTPAIAQSKAAAAPAPAQPKISKQAMKPIIDLQTAVTANDVANIPARLAAANAAAQTPEDRFFIAQLQTKAALNAKDESAQLAAVQAQLDSGGAGAERATQLRLVLGNTKLKAKDYAGALSALQPIAQLEPANTDAMLLTAEALNGVGRTAEAVPMLQKAISTLKAQGKPAPENIYRRAVALSAAKKLPGTSQLAMEWVQAFPTPTNWRDTIRLYMLDSGLSDTDLIDAFRLQRATGSLNGESDYYRYAATAAMRGLPGEAKAVIDEGTASKAIDKARPTFKEVYAQSSAKVTADRASLPAGERTALAGSSAKAALGTGDAYMGYGDFAKAATLYRAALGKSGVDSSQANLRLGVALAQAGDKAGATTALNAVTGPRAGIAKLWLVWLGTRT